MFYGNNVQDTRNFFLQSWQKYKQKIALEPLEKQIVDVILDHPEYHPYLEKPLIAEETFFPELGQTNPFLHMGLHLAIRDQIHTNRPFGIQLIYKQVLSHCKNKQEAEHLFMECLAETLWAAQRNHAIPDETAFLHRCQDLLKRQ